MLTRDRLTLPAPMLLMIGLAGIPIGLMMGWLIGINPALPVLFIVAIAVLFSFIQNFEQTVLGLLILRSSLDIFSAQQIPAAFALGINALTIFYVLVALLSRRKVYTDGFWWFFCGWVALQGLWVILLPLGGLGLGASELPDAVREWVRLFSWLMVYLLVMQLKSTLKPEQVINALFLSLVAPLTAALLQILLPSSMLPAFLVPQSTALAGAASAARINGTLGHPNGFSMFTVLFMGLTLWKIEQSKNRSRWLLLLGLIVFILVGAKSLSGLAMMAVFTLLYFLPRLNFISVFSGLILLTVVGALFFSTEVGQHRLTELYSTPLLNPDIDWSRAVAMQLSDSASQANSFNWRLVQWTFLLRSWQEYPLLGHGLATTASVSIFNNTAHNDYIRALVEGGIVGFTLFVCFLLAQFVRLVQLQNTFPVNKSQRQLCTMLTAFLVAMAIVMLTGNVMVLTPLYFYWWTLVAIAGWNWNSSEESSTKELSCQKFQS